MVYGRIKRYFGAHSDITVGNITANDIRAFYDYLMKSELTGATIIHFHSLLHRAFSQAFKDEIIDSNPFDRVDRPKKTKYRGEYYSEEELVKLLDLARDDTIYPAIVLAGGLGLRRSEALGVRWSRIDCDESFQRLSQSERTAENTFPRSASYVCEHPAWQGSTAHQCVELSRSQRYINDSEHIRTP